MNEKESKLCILPLQRIKMVMKNSPETRNIGNEVCFLVAKAAEGFVAYLLRQALKASDNKTLIDYSDLASVVESNESFVCLRDIIPPKIKGSQYLEILKQIEELERRNALDDEDL